VGMEGKMREPKSLPSTSSILFNMGGIWREGK